MKGEEDGSCLDLDLCLCFFEVMIFSSSWSWGLGSADIRAEGCTAGEMFGLMRSNWLLPVDAGNDLRLHVEQERLPGTYGRMVEGGTKVEEAYEGEETVRESHSWEV